MYSRRTMLLSYFLICFISASTASYQTGKGRFESINGNRYTDAKSMDENDTKFFLNRNRERMPPAHDTVCLQIYLAYNFDY